MSMYVAKIRVSLKKTVNDPEGLTVMKALQTLGFGAVASVRSGKFIEIELAAKDPKEARVAVESMCQQLLANPVIETYQYDLDHVKEAFPNG